MLFFFREQPPADHITSISKDGNIIFNVQSDKEPGIGFPEIYFLSDSIMFNPEFAGDYILTSASGLKYEINAAKSLNYLVDDFTGKVSFFNRTYMDQPYELDISKLIPWNNFSNPDIRYFSGTAKYDLNFDLPADIENSVDSIIMTPGNLRETAEIILNDSLLGTAWCPDYFFNVKGIVKAGRNNLKISVSNVYRNRFIGDMIQYGRLENLWTTSPIDQLLRKDMPLKESGVLGPVKFYEISPVALKSHDRL